MMYGPIHTKNSDYIFAQNDIAAGVQFSATTGQTCAVHGEGQLCGRRYGVTVLNYGTIGSFQVRDLSKDDVAVGT